MVLSRSYFFLLLTVLLIGPFYGSKLMWVNSSNKTTGTAWFMGHTLELNGSISNHLVILFMRGKDSITFNGATNIGFKVGDIVPVRYQEADPEDAKINTTFCIWGDTCIYSILPGLFLLILFLTPARFDPVIPWKAKVRIGVKPLIKIIPKNERSL
ncbi:MAG: hypothetical protein QM802_23350 [Agriterribacter sp.]